VTDSRRIGFVTTSFPRFEDDIAGTFVEGMARELARRGHRLEVVAPEPDRSAQWTDRDGWLGPLRVYPAPYVRPRRLGRLFYGAGVPDNLARAPWLAALIPAALTGLLATVARRAARWDAVVSHWLLPSAPIAGLARRADARHLAIAHSGDVHLLGRLPFGAVMARGIARSADHLGFVSRKLEGDFLELTGPASRREIEGRTSVVPMGIDSAGLVSKTPRGELRRVLGLDRFAVLFVGRLVSIKGVDLAVEAVAGADDVQLVIAGDGPERGRLERLARTRRVDATFLGAVDPRRRAELLSACDAVVLPSRVMPDGRQEGLPLALVEALAAGRPVVASRTGAVEEIVEDGVSGLVVAPDDPAALRSAIERIRDDKTLAARLAAVGKQRVADRDWKKLGDLYEGLLFG